MTTVDGGQADRGIDALALPMPPQPHPYLAQMARFCDGDLHAQRRADLLAVLPPAEGLREAAFARASAQLTDRLDVVPLAYQVPVARGTVAALAGYVVAERGPDRPRPNIKMPSRLVMARR